MEAGLAVSFKIADVNADGILRSVEDDANSRVGSSEADDLCGRGAVAGHPLSAELAQAYAVAYSEEFFLDLHRCCPITPAVLATRWCPQHSMFRSMTQAKGSTM